MFSAVSFAVDSLTPTIEKRFYYINLGKSSTALRTTVNKQLDCVRNVDLVAQLYKCLPIEI